MKITLRGFLFGAAITAASASHGYAAEPALEKSTATPNVERTTDDSTQLPIQPSGAVVNDDVGRVTIPRLLPQSQVGQQPTNAQLIESWSTDPEDVFQPVSLQEAAPVPVAPQTFQQVAVPTPSPLAARLFGSPSRNRSLLGANRRSSASAPGSSVVLGSESKGRKTTDVGSLLGRSTGALGIASERRSPIVNDVRVRGSQVGQLLASGSYWFPVRQDLDTLLSKIDSSIIDDVIVIKGPYSSKYGPGYSFVDFELATSPRYENGFESHGSTTLNYSTNGEQWYGRQSFWGGDADYGYRVGYGIRSGVDYETGDGERLPSGYKSGNLDVAVGFDLDEASSLEFSYLRLDQADVQIPNQVNTIEDLQTDSWEVIYKDTDLEAADVFIAETWYNTTSLDGNAQDSGKRSQIPLLDETLFAKTSTGWNASTGFNLAMTWIEGEGSEVTAGVDMRYLQQQYDERTQWALFDPSWMVGDPLPTGPVADVSQNTNYPLPRAQQINPGLYLESVDQVTDRLVIRCGGRLDLVHSNADSSTVRPNVFGESVEVFVGGRDGIFRQDFRLGQAFITGDYVVNENVKMTGGAGFGMRAPSMGELYSSGFYSSITPQWVLTSSFGNPSLNPEQRSQIDLGMEADFGSFRGGLNGYHAWIKDYIALDRIGFVREPGGGDVVAPAFAYTNSELVTLAGFEGYGEYDVSDWLSTFATISYTEGRDHTRRDSNYVYSGVVFGAPGRSNSADEEAPLNGIFPLEARAGLRLTEPQEGNWGAEFSARIVDNQDRIATNLLETPTAGFTTYDLRGFLQVADGVLFVAGIENLTDKNYQEHFDARNVTQVRQPGANYYFGTEFVY